MAERKKSPRDCKPGIANAIYKARRETLCIRQLWRSLRFHLPHRLHRFRIKTRRQWRRHTQIWKQTCPVAGREVVFSRFRSDINLLMAQGVVYHLRREKHRAFSIYSSRFALTIFHFLLLERKHLYAVCMQAKRTNNSYYFPLYSLSVLPLAKSQQLILEISAAYWLV